MSESAGHPRDLEHWTEHLSAHFTDLRSERDDQVEGAPVFALEHGLGTTDIEAVAGLIEDTISRGKFPPALMLPLCVLSAEVGYQFSGSEYWISFEQRVPSWRECGDRAFVRGALRHFADRFSGAIPKGAWADWFTIISWPITHSVLPTDLQRHLARLLFESRWEMSPALLEEPATLGRVLAARSSGASERFRSMAQNTELLGLIASALLAETEGASPYLTRGVLTRIVEDLARERQARVWLSGARSVAHRVRTHGFGGVQGAPPRNLDPAPSDRSARVTIPRLSVEERDGEWQPVIQIPDLSPILELRPGLDEEVAGRRLIVAGADRPDPTGTLGISGLPLRLRSWPRSGRPLFQLEGADDATNMTLADEYALSGTSPWLFHLGSEGIGTEVRGRMVVPGRRYLVVFEARPVNSKPGWVTETQLRGDGASGWLLDCPATLDEDDLSALSAFDLGAITEIRIEPTGVTAPFWDGSGRTEWLEGETPMFRIALTTPAEAVLCRMGTEEASFLPDRGPGEAELLLAFPDIEVGDHELTILTAGEGSEGPQEAGRLEITVRRPEERPAGGDPREGMAIIATPATPTFEELWSEHAHLQVQGPEGVKAKMSFSLIDEIGISRKTVNRSIRLPVAGSDWRGIFAASFRHDREVQRMYPDASGCRIEVAGPQIGGVEIECYRRFQPLGLVHTALNGEESLRVVNNTGEPAAATLWEFGYPDLAKPLECEDETVLDIGRGGLVVAEAGPMSAAAIVLPVSKFKGLQGLPQNPHVKERPRVFQDLQDLVELASRWASADLPPNPVAAGLEQGRVLEAIDREVWGCLGGPRWRSVERRFHREERLSTRELRDAVGREGREQAFALGLRGKLNAISGPSHPDRIRCLAAMLAANGDQVGVRQHRFGFAAEVVELASAPGRLGDRGPAAYTRTLRDLIPLGGLFRAVRYAILTEIVSDEPAETDEPSP